MEEKGLDPNTIRHNWTMPDVLKYNAILDMRLSGKLAEAGLDKVKEKTSGN